MAKLTVDTVNDSTDDLEHAVELIQKTLGKRAEKEPTANELVREESSTQEEDTLIETPFLNVKLTSDTVRPAISTQTQQQVPASISEPTVNELLEQEAITEDELQELYKNVPGLEETFRQREDQAQKTEIPTTTEDGEEAFIEIVEEYDEEEKNDLADS